MQRRDADIIVVRGWKNNKEEASQWRFRWRKGKKLLFPLCSHDCLPAPVAKASSCIQSTDPRSMDDPARGTIRSCWIRPAILIFLFHKKSE